MVESGEQSFQCPHAPPLVQSVNVYAETFKISLQITPI